MPSDVGPFKYRKKPARGISPEKWIWEAENVQRLGMDKPRDVEVSIVHENVDPFGMGQKKWVVKAFGADPDDPMSLTGAELKELGQFDSFDEAHDAARRWMRKW